MNEAKIAKVMGGKSALLCEVHTGLDFAEVITAGVPIRAVKSLQKYIGASDMGMAELIAITPKTFRSRKKRFKTDESDHAYTIAKIVVEAEKALGSKEAALEWLNTKQPALGDRVPMRLIRTSAGMQAVEDLLGRIEYGVYS